MKTHKMIVDPEIRRQLAMALHDTRCLYKVYPFLSETNREWRINERRAMRFGAETMAFFSQLHTHDSKAFPTMAEYFHPPR